MSDKRVALIAGGSGGIGRAVAHRLGKNTIVWIGYNRNPKAAETIADEIRKNGGSAFPIVLDLRDSRNVEASCETISSKHGRLDILVNCAAVNVEAPAAGMDDEMWRQVMEVNLDGAFRLCRAAAKPMILNRWGRIINMSSISALKGGRGQINYAAGKAGVEAMTRVLALELGRKGVLVNCVAPGVIETEMSRRVREGYGDKILESVAVGRFGRTEDIAAAVEFLCSEDASYISGQVIRVDGGMGL